MPAKTIQRADYRESDVLNGSHFCFSFLLAQEKEFCATWSVLESGWGQSHLRVLRLDMVSVFSQLHAEVSGSTIAGGGLSTPPWPLLPFLFFSHLTLHMARF